MHQESPIRKSNTSPAKTVTQKKEESACKQMPNKASVSSKQTSRSPPEIVRRSKRASKAPVNYDEEKIITYEYVAARTTRSKVSKNPLISGSKPVEAKSEFVRHRGKDLIDQKDEPKHAGSDDEGEIERELQKEKEHNVVIHSEKQLEDMKLLFNMPEEEINRIKLEQDTFLK